VVAVSSSSNNSSNNSNNNSKQANINVKSRRFGVIVTPFSRESEYLTKCDIDDLISIVSTN